MVTKKTTEKGPLGAQDALIAAMSRREPRPRGRPAASAESVSLADMQRGLVGLVLKVVKRAHAAGYRRGAITAATRDVAAEHSIAFGTLKKAVTRHAWVRQAHDEMRDILDRWDSNAAELDRRMLGMPQDIRRALEPFDMHGVLHLLRAGNVDGTCPQWLVDWVHGPDFPSPK